MFRKSRAFLELAFAVVLIFGCCMHGPALAAWNTRVVGGTGGAPFRSECRRNDVVIGFNLRYGVAIDAIVPICIPLNPERTEWAGEAYEPTQYFGGSGGSYYKLACQPGDAVREVELTPGDWGDHFVVRKIDLWCYDLQSGTKNFVSMPYPRETRPRLPVKIGCGSNEWVTGIYGRSGALVDQLGLVCDTIQPSAPPKIKPIGKKPQPPIGVVTKPDLDLGKIITKPGGAPEAPAPQTPEKPQNLASVVLDVDVYKAPGKGKRIGVLRKGSQVTLIEPCRGNNWCHVGGEAVPNGEGWVYSGPDYRSLQF